MVISTYQKQADCPEIAGHLTTLNARDMPDKITFNLDELEITREVPVP